MELIERHLLSLATGARLAAFERRMEVFGKLFGQIVDLPARDPLRQGLHDRLAHLPCLCGVQGGPAGHALDEEVAEHHGGR